MKYAVALVLTLALPAHAGTVYRDRYIPGTACIVNFDGSNINAGLIQQVNIGTYNIVKYTGFWSGYEVTGQYTSLRATLVNGQYYEVTTGDLQAKQDAFLKQIKESCK